MKRAIFAAVVSFTLIGPMTGATLAEPERDGQGQQKQFAQRYEDRQDHRDQRRAWRDVVDARWDDSLHNGFYRDGRWRYGPPAADQVGPSTIILGYRPWSPGQRLGYYYGRYEEVDYQVHNLRRPARGYHWVRDNDGDYLLAALANGEIVQVILSGAPR